MSRRLALTSALRRVPTPGRRTAAAVHVRLYDERGHATTLDADEEPGAALLEAATELLRAADTPPPDTNVPESVV